MCAIAPDGAVIEVGGVGLLVQCTPGTLAGLRTGERARVATSLVVREDALTLYGFASDDERDVFELVQTASGVGPRLALAMLAVVQPGRAAPGHRGGGRGRADPGAGHRPQGRAADRAGTGRAARLARRAGRGAAGRRPAAGPPRARAALWRDQVRAGLVNLGWPARDAEQAIAAVAADLHGQPGRADGRRGRVRRAAGRAAQLSRT